VRRPSLSTLLAPAPVLLLAGTATLAAERCTVADPSGTPLNVRAEPEGRVTGTLANGRVVSLADTIRDGRGRPWSLVYDFWSGDKIGWVFRAHLACP